ncbi:hypothetical protein BIV57_03335 [Mangrovactinospora gilvigrisea]|uniref:YbhB/YbcL family Raf kinase inhibitor-like protein n=1 Tax=Mangrovactinospora gilvigrisea TaxID=1428644 RepID=A0A1J7BJZ9_9ACTN|nr:YbhB/YbcL family Raf kinase inhibitor-like protein [Mangrovactinospora gilvigrisea]OIV38917.1 hypothetical protein BIV57_03335 [Mangrovactinospora gilvigrisea]
MTQRPPLPYDQLPPVPAFTLTSEDFEAGVTLPDRHVYAADNVSPQLSWSGAPEGTESYVVTCYDPDAPTGSGFWHWVLIDVPKEVTSLPGGAGTGAFPGLPDGAVHVRNDYGSRDFGGAAPPPGDPAHRYVFAVHAVDLPKLGPDGDASPAYVGFNLHFHTLGRAVLVAEYAAPKE